MPHEILTDKQKEYKVNQQKRIASLVIGAKDNSGYTITRIFARGDEHVIYEIDTPTITDSIRIKLDTITEDDERILLNFNKIRANYAQIKGLLYKVEDTSSIKSRIAHILSHGLDLPDEANKQLKDLIKEIDNDYNDQSKHRVNYLLTSFVCVAIGVIVSIFIYTNRLLIHSQYIREIIFMSSAASIGGFISVTRRIREMKFEKSVPSHLYVFYSLERIVFAVLAGITVYFAIKCKIIFTIIEELDKPIWGYLLFAIVAGFSETLMPNLLISLEKEKK